MSFKANNAPSVYKSLRKEVMKRSNLREKISLVDNDKIITNEMEIAIVMSDFFSNIMKNLNISEKIILALIENVRDPTLKAILKHC